MDSATQFAATSVSISLTASLILLGIWLSGRPERKSGAPATISRDEGIVWMCLASGLWFCTGILQLLYVTRVLASPALFFRALFSVANSVCFVLATANVDEVKEAKGMLGDFFEFVREHRFSILWGCITPVVILGLLDLKNGGRYYRVFDVVIGIPTLYLITRGFFIAFRKREIPILPWVSVGVFMVFAFAQFGELLEVRKLKLALGIAEFQSLSSVAGAVRASSAGMASLLFIALTFSWMHKELKLKVDVQSIPLPRLQQVAAAGENSINSAQK